ncbi:MAG: SpoIIE family protein phosphatase [Leptospiraceae bacterium]|nr:SpoIIE family protein phosphatase [Leptospiraceae bacterium]MCP5494220.1 SpoIIE family protein phosphatase [Leptospiraceae bacterium]
MIKIKKFFFSNLSIRSKLILTISFLIVILLIVASAFFTIRTSNQIETALIKRGFLLTKSLSLVSANLIAGFQFSDVENAISEVVNKDKEILYGYLENANGSPIVFQDKVISDISKIKQEYKKLDKEILSMNPLDFDFTDEHIKIKKLYHGGEECIEVKTPILVGGINYGFIRFGLSTEYIKELQFKNFLFSLLLVIIFITIGLVSSIRFANVFSQPILKLKDASIEIANKNFNFVIDINTQDEIGMLAKSFGIMRQSIQMYQNSLEKLNQELESKVIERTKELQKSLDEVNHLHEQKKADYFLTANLIKPLMGNPDETREFISVAEIKTVKITKDIVVEILLEQYVQFVFHKYKVQIGGDICIVDSIVLKGDEYTVFLNADAMGKSIQGAGGSLIIGSVFRAFLTRTHNMLSFQELDSNQWLTECFWDLHNVLLPLDGAMLVSAVVALINNKNGKMLFINAEHPGAILYRDQQVQILPQKNMLKLGTPIDVDAVKLNRFSLKKGDIIIVGSDGKDDIVITESKENNSRVINRDENLFLSIIREAKGDLEKIKKLMLEKGNLMDDLSIVKLSFKTKK